jgi:hypothetical protein
MNVYRIFLEKNLELPLTRVKKQAVWKGNIIIYLVYAVRKIEVAEDVTFSGCQSR